MASLKKSPNGSDTSLPSSKSEASMDDNIFDVDSVGDMEQEWSPADDLNVLQQYKNKFQESTEMVQDRNNIIKQLSFRLETTLKALEEAKTTRDGEIEMLVQDLDSYKQQIQQANEIIARLKTKNKDSTKEIEDSQSRYLVLEARNLEISYDNAKLAEKLAEAENRLKVLSDMKQGLTPVNAEQEQCKTLDFRDQSIQVELMTFSDHKDVSPTRKLQSVDFVTTFTQTDVGAPDVLLPVDEPDTNTINSVEGDQQMSLLAELEKYSVPAIHDHFPSGSSNCTSQEPTVFPSDAYLKQSLDRIICINNIAKTVKYLLGAVSTLQKSGIVQDSQIHQSADDTSKLECLNVSIHSSLTIVNSIASSRLEVLRDEELSENLSSMSQFLQHEMENTFREFSASLDESTSIRLKMSEELNKDSDTNGASVNNAIHPSFEGEVEDSMSILNLKESSGVVAQELTSFMNHIQELSDLVDNYKSTSLEQTGSCENESIEDEEEGVLLCEEIPYSDQNMMPDNENYDSYNVYEELDDDMETSLNVSRTPNVHLYTIHEDVNEEQSAFPKCGKYIDELKAQHALEIENLKQSLEFDHLHEKNLLSEKLKILEQQNSEGLQQLQNARMILECELENLRTSYDGKIAETAEKLQRVKDMFNLAKVMFENKHKEDLKKVEREIENKYENEKKEILSTNEILEDRLKSLTLELNKLKDENVEIKCYWQTKIADLVTEHSQDTKNLEHEYQESLKQKQKLFEEEKMQVVSQLTEVQERTIQEMQTSLEKVVEDRTLEAVKNFDQVLLAEKTMHTEELSAYQKKVEELLDEKRELLQKMEEQYGASVVGNQQILKELCSYIQNQISKKMNKIHTYKSSESDLDSSFIETLKELNQNILNGINHIFQKDPMNGKRSPLTCDIDDSQVKWSVTHSGTPDLSMDEVQKIVDAVKAESAKEINKIKEDYEKRIEDLKSTMHDDSECGRLVFLDQVEELKNTFDEQLVIYKDQNDRLSSEIQIVTGKLTFLEESNVKLKEQLQAVERKPNEEVAVDLQEASSRPSVTSSSPDIHSWQVQAAQTNGRLLHVLSDLVKTFIDVEHDINERLAQLGLTGLRSEILMHPDDDTGQSVGSREDFAGIGIGDSHLELHEDGPDLTPRAWEIFNSMGAYEADTENEDVVISASRKLRQAVDHVLNLLSLAFEKHKEQEFKSLLKRNEDLSHELQEESQDRDNLELDLINAQSVIRKYEAEKHQLEDENYHLNEEKSSLLEQITSLKLKISQLEDERERSYEQRKQLREQVDLLSSRLGDPQKMPSGNENEVPELLQENTRLASERVSIQKSLSKERQNLQSRVQQLELMVEELTSEKDELLDKSRKEVEDLKSQIDSIEKQLQSNRKFMNEQAVEREQEREESMKEIKKLQNLLKEKEKVQVFENQSKREAEALELQLKMKIDEHRALIAKKEEIEHELRQALDKIHDLREVIAELEKQLESKNRIEINLKQKLGSVMKSLSVHEKCNEDLKSQLEEYTSSKSTDESLEKIRSLEEQLSSKSQQLEQISQSEVMLNELRGQIHFLEAKVDQKIRKIESLQLVPQITSPVMSDDASHSESHDADVHQVPRDDGFEMSPRSVHWLEIRRLEEKVCHLLQIEEELVKLNKELSTQLKQCHKMEDEMGHEKQVLHQKYMEQLLQISKLKTEIDVLRERSQPSLSPQIVAEIEKLREKLQFETDQRESLVQEVTELKKEKYSLELKFMESNNAVKKMQNDAMQSAKYISRNVQTSNENILSAVPHLEQETAQRLTFLEHLVVSKDEVISQLRQRVVELERSTQAARNELEIEQNQLEKDFDTVQDMVQKKEQELASLHEETENQMCLQSSLISLREELKEKKSIQEQLIEKLHQLELGLEEEKQSHSHEIEMWQKKTEDISQRYAAEQDALKKQISALKEDVFSTTDFNDVEIKQIQEKITAAAEKLKVAHSGDCQDLFQKMVYHILEQAVQVKVNALKKQNQIEIDMIQKSWGQKFEEDCLRMRQHAKDQLKKDIIDEKMKNKMKIQQIANALKQRYVEQMQKHLNEKDHYWQERLKEVEVSLKLEKEQSLMEELAQKVAEVRTQLEEKHKKEIMQLKNKLEQMSRDRESQELMIKTHHEQEKAILCKDFEKKFSSMGEKMNAKLDEEKQELESKYQKQIQELQQELNAKLEGERQKLHEQKEQEAGVIRSIFEKELGKISQLHLEEMESLKESKDKSHEELLHRLLNIFEKKFKDVQVACTTKLSQERAQDIALMQVELQKLQRDLEEKFEREKQDILKARDEQTKAQIQKEHQSKELLEKIETRELQNLVRDVKALEEKWQKKMDEGEKNLVTAHKAEVLLLKRNFELQLESQKNHLKKIHDDRLREQIEQFQRKLNNSNKIIKALKASSFGDFIRSSSSEGNCSEETSSSNVQDPSSVNLKHLVRTVHKNAANVLTSIGKVPESSEQLHLQQLLDERQSIISMLNSAFNCDNHEVNLKTMIEKTLTEIEQMRVALDAINRRDHALCSQIAQLQNLVASHNLDHCSKSGLQTDINSQLETILHIVKDSIPILERLDTKVTLSATSNNADNAVSSVEKPRSAFMPKNNHFTSDVPLEEVSPFLLGRDDSPKIEQLHSIIFEKDRIISDLSFRLESLQDIRDMKRGGGGSLLPNLRKTDTDKVATSTPFCSNNVQVQNENAAIQTSRDPFKVQVHYLTYKYHRSESFRKALIYQKKYLLSLLSSYQASEEMTIAILSRMGVSPSLYPELSYTRSVACHAKHKGLIQFRYTVLAVVSISRMKYLVSKSANRLRLPPTQIIENNVSDLLFAKNSSFKVPYVNKSMVSKSSSSSITSKSKQNEGARIPYRSNQESSSDSGSEEGASNEYVDRLKSLHKHLGLHKKC